MTATETPARTSPTDRRHAAMRVVCDRFGYMSDDEMTAAQAEITTAIRALAPLGKTDRWTANVEGWAAAVETEPIRWAFHQFSVYTAYAA